MHMNIKVPKFSRSLICNFLLSTFVPMAIITVIISYAYNVNYTRDISRLTNTTLDSICRNLDTYLVELDQFSMTPYYNEGFFTSLASLLQKGEAPNTLERMEIEQAVGNMLSFSQYTRDDIIGTLITTDQHSLFASTSLIDCYLDPDYDFGNSEWYQKAVAKSGEAVFFPPHKLDYYVRTGRNYTDPQVISVARAIVNIRTRQPLCVIKIDANMASFRNMFEEVTWHVPSVILITDEENHLIYTNGALDAEALDVLSTTEKTMRYGNHTWYTYHQTENEYGWNVYVLLDKNAMDQRSVYIYLIAIILYLIGLVVATLVYLLYSRKMVNTVQTINRMVSEIQKGNFHGKYYFAGNNELQILIDSVTYITTLLEQKIDQEYKLTIQQKDFQFKALQAQINPHFLFNTLTGFIALNQIGKTNELEHSLYALTSLLHYTLKEDRESTVEQEIRFLNDYCSLQKLRFQDKLNYNIYYEPETATFKIPKLILQPLVENAIIHGIEPLSRPCLLNVDITKYKENEILITVEDDGAGFDIGNGETHIGLSNVKERLQLLNADNQISIESIPNEGTIVTIVLKEWV